MERRAILKRLARTGGLACMIAGAVLCGQAVFEALNGRPDATLHVALYGALFSFGGMVFLWGRRA
ncbi:hypothetical protein [Thalassorhabdomicrobium marinisediminis]|uniref:hypothetical protein n=1 Tax=Thalassorhabdomicrobium marinisediminis TaxID=2170577 RepID=UPI0024933C17|nr:hypothetical protein [Thalassorhabdomicrobium marinisediminis]